MSVSSRQRVGWLNQNYDKMILVVILLALLVSAVFLMWQTNRVKQVLVEAKWAVPPSEPIMAKPVDLAPFDAARVGFTKPFQSTPSSIRMMASELRVSCVECGKPIPYNATKCPFCNAKQPEMLNPEEIDTDGDGIPDKGEAKFGLSPSNPDDAAADSDEDGFTNLEEYRAGTDLGDAASFPSPAAKLRVVKIGANPFKLRFQGEAKLSDGSIRYQLNLRTLERTYFVRIGDEIEGFKAVEYLPQPPQGPAVVLQQGTNRVVLLKGVAKTQYEMTADLVFLIDRSRYRVKVGDAISIKDREYKVIDIRRDSVLIRDEKARKDEPLGPLSESEKMLLQGGMGVSAPGPLIPDVPRPER